MPKAAPVPQFKMLSIQVFYILSGMTPEDVLYVCLPLYHSTASLLGTGLSLVNGLTLVLRDKCVPVV